MRKRRLGKRGSAMVEFSLCSTLLILLFMGGTDMARVFGLATSLTQAAKAGAQFASYSSGNAGNAAGITAAAESAAPGIGMTVTTSRVCYCGATAITCGATSCESEPSMYTQVKTVGRYDAMLPYWGSAAAIPVSGTARIRVK